MTSKTSAVIRKIAARYTQRFDDYELTPLVAGASIGGIMAGGHALATNPKSLPIPPSALPPATPRPAFHPRIGAGPAEATASRIGHGVDVTARAVARYPRVGRVLKHTAVGTIIGGLLTAGGMAAHTAYNNFRRANY